MTYVPTVLFVDDDVDLTAGLRLMLRKERFRVLTCNSPFEALEILAREPIDVVVSDDQMPLMSGAELLAKLRDEYPDVVRILLTGQTDIKRAVNAVNDASVFRFLLKPCDRPFLVATIEAALASGMSLPPARLEEQRVFEEELSQLWLAHQPIYERNGSVAGFELLMRSSSPSFRGPEQLIAMASLLERSADLDRSVGNRAVYAAEALGDRLLFVNVDPPSLGRDDLFAPLLPQAHHIVLEITERDARGEKKQLEARIRELKEMGFRVAVDDLGSGYAGLNSVVELSPDIVKLDMELIRDVDQSFVKRRLVHSLCDAAEDLGIKVVAEGIERLAELDATFEAGCHYFQGYLLGRPGRDPVSLAWPRSSRSARPPARSHSWLPGI